MSRRGLLTAGGATGLGALLTACGTSPGSGADSGTSDPAAGKGSSAGSSDGSAGASGPFRFTDDRKKTVSLDRVPTTLVAYIGVAALLHDYGIACEGVFGPTTRKDGSPDPMAGDVDVSKVTVLGNTWGEFTIEKYAALDPQLLISHMFEPPALWYVPDQSAGKILALAPSVGIDTAKVPLTTPLQRYAELAAALGADLDSAANAGQKARFEKASVDLRTAAKAHGRITVLAAAAAADSLYVSTPAAACDLRYYRGLGVDLIVPDHVTGGFFETLSWENADKYRPDVIMLDSRTASLQPKDLTGKPTWTGLPAVKAGQIIGWPSEPIYSYGKCAERIEALTKALTTAKKVS